MNRLPFKIWWLLHNRVWNEGLALARPRPLISTFKIQIKRQGRTTSALEPILDSKPCQFSINLKIFLQVILANKDDIPPNWIVYMRDSIPLSRVNYEKTVMEKEESESYRKNYNYMGRKIIIQENIIYKT